MARRTVLIGTVVLILLLVLLRGVRPGRGISSPPPPRACEAPLRYQRDRDGRSLTLTGTKLLYHWTVNELVEERMNLYDGTVTLACGESLEAQRAKYVDPDVQVDQSGIVPVGTILARVASGLQIFEGKSITYADFPQILQEHWREYDCYLQGALRDDPAFPFLEVSKAAVRSEREAVSVAHDRLLAVLRGSEQLLPAHVGLSCLTRMSLDMRNALGLYSDVSACVPARLSLPRTSLRAP